MNLMAPSPRCIPLFFVVLVIVGGSFVPPSSSARRDTLARKPLEEPDDAARDESTSENRSPLPPLIQSASSEGSDAISSFTIPDRWDMQLYAAEPDVANPVVLFIDNQNRVFVCETFRQNQGVTDNRKHDEKWLMADLQAKTVEDRIAYHKELLGDAADSYTLQDDRIRMLLDTDDDGQVDESVVFASEFNQLEDGTGAGVLVRGNQAYYTCIPNLWLINDVDGDGRADERKILSGGYGVRVAFRGHDMHGLMIGPDGRLYFSIGDRGYHVETENGVLANSVSGAVFRCELDGSNLEVVATGLRNPQELAFDDYGQWFTGDNNSDSGDQARWVHLVPGSDSGWRMYYQYLPDRGPFNREKIWYPYSDETPAYIVPPIANIGDGPSGLTCYPGTGFGDELANAFFLCDFRGQASNSGIRLIRNKPVGAFFEIEASEQPIWSILCTDADFGPDGALYISDWVNGWDGEGKGRIYRVTHPEHQQSDIVRETRALLASDWKGVSSDELASRLSHVDRRVRLEAQWELATRGVESVPRFVEQVTNRALEPRFRLHGVWGLGQLARLQASASAARALKQIIESELAATADPYVIAHAVTMLAESKQPMLTEDLLKTLLANDSPLIQSAASHAVGMHGLDALLPSIRAILIENANRDPILRHAAVMGLAGMKGSQLSKLATDESHFVRIAAVVALRKQAERGQDVASILEAFVADANAKVQLEAVRAIHDLPELHAALPSVAALLEDRTHTNAALVQRALNANFRVGKADEAQRLASFAADVSREESLRLEAIRMLTDWQAPKPLDRVLNDYRPLAPRDASAIKQALEEHFTDLARQPDDVRTIALSLAAKLNISSAEPLLREIFADANAPSEQRTAAFVALLDLQPKDRDALLELGRLDRVPEIRIATMKAFSESNQERAIEMIGKAILSSELTERQAGWDTAGSLNSSEANSLIASGIESYMNGEISRSVALNLLEASQDRLTPDLTAKLTEYRDALSGELGPASDNPLAYTECLEGGNWKNGRELFFGRTQLSCVRCHRVGSQGGAVGPELTTLGNEKSAEYLLEAIVAPSSTIAKGFETVLVATEDGEVLTGILKSEDDEFLNLVNADGAVVTIEQEVIIDRRPGLSSMPADLMQYLTRRELRDLVTYLKMLDGKNPEVVAESAPGGHE